MFLCISREEAIARRSVIQHQIPNISFFVIISEEVLDAVPKHRPSLSDQCTHHLLYY